MLTQEHFTTLERKIEKFSHILEERPDDGLTVLALAEASFRRGLKLEALTAYQQVTSTSPVPEAHLAVAEIYSQQDMTTEAYGELRRLFELDPENVEARLLAHELLAKAPAPDDIADILNRSTSEKAFEEAERRFRIQKAIHNRELQERTRNHTLEPGAVIHEYYVEEAKKKLLDVDEQMRKLEELKQYNASLDLVPRADAVAPVEEPAAQMTPDAAEPVTEPPALDADTGAEAPMEPVAAEQAESLEIAPVDEAQITPPEAVAPLDPPEDGPGGLELLRPESESLEVPTMELEGLDSQTGVEPPALGSGEVEAVQIEVGSPEPEPEPEPTATEGAESFAPMQIDIGVENLVAPELPEPGVEPPSSDPNPGILDIQPIEIVGEDMPMPKIEIPSSETENAISIEPNPQPPAIEPLPTAEEQPVVEEMTTIPTVMEMPEPTMTPPPEPVPSIAVEPEEPAPIAVVDEAPAIQVVTEEPAPEAAPVTEAPAPAPASSQDSAALQASRQAFYESRMDELSKLTGTLARTRGVTSIFLVSRDGQTIDSVVKDNITEERVGELVGESFEFLLAYAKSPAYWVLECSGGIFVMQTLDENHVLIAIGQAGANFGALRYTMDKTKTKFGLILKDIPS